MSEVNSLSEEERCLFQPFTRKSLAAIEVQIAEENAKKKEKAQPDPRLEQGMVVPRHLQGKFTPEMISRPLEDIDSFYRDQKTFVVVNRWKSIFRFSATDALWILGPFNPLRRITISTVIHPLFSLFIFITILINCFLMIMPSSPGIELLEILFMAIYTFEAITKIMARGFILKPFTYLRDPWNWLDFIIVLLGALDLLVYIGDFSAIRALRVLRALKAIAVIPGLKNFVNAIVQSAKNLRDVLRFTICSLVVSTVVGLQIYMGVLTQKCVMEFPTDGSWGNMTTENWDLFNQNDSNWYVDESGSIPVCGNSSGARTCPPGYHCLQGYGYNPNYGYTSFDTFGMALLSVFRIVTRDFWEDLYQLVLQSAGPWHILFFIVIIFFGSFYILTLILTVIAITYDEIQKKAEKEEAAEDEAVRRVEEAARETKMKDNDEKQLQGITSGSKEEADSQDNMKDVMVLNDIEQGAGRQSKVLDKNDDVKDPTCLNKVVDMFCVWDCCKPWVKLQKSISFLVLNPYFDFFITLCIILNVLCMALDHHDMDRDMDRFLRTANYIFTVIYMAEAVLKILALSPKYYFQDNWNVFDFTIVGFAILEYGLEGVQGLSVLRSFRLLRVFRLAKSWPSLNMLVSTMGKTMGSLNNMMIVLWLIVFIFSVMGMQIFGKSYIDNVDRFPDGDLPRWNFTDFIHSFMIVFRMLCGEWIESMWDCKLIGDNTCTLYFLIIVIIGNLVVFNIFVGLLMINFKQSKLTDHPTNQETQTEGKSRFSAWFKGNKPSNPDAAEVEATENPPTNFQLKALRIVENKYFEFAVVFMILLSSLTLALEDVYLPERQTLRRILAVMDIIFLVFFIVEMIIKWSALGFKKYFTDAWCLIDFAIVMFSLISVTVSELGSNELPVICFIRCLKALRPLRALSRWECTRIVVTTLVKAIPSVANVFSVCLIYWLVFAIIGVQLFAGKFYKCVDNNGTTFSHEIIPDKNVCIAENNTWENSLMNFDHVGNAYMCLFQVATFKGWIQIMNDAIDSREVNVQPIRETNIYMYLYFVFFIIFGSFFTLNLFIGSIIGFFNQQKGKFCSSLEMFMTDDQRRCYSTKRKMGSKIQPKAIPRPQWGPQAAVYDIVTSKKFEIFIVLVICFNILSMGLDHFGQSEAFSTILDYINLTCIVIYTIELLMKVFALRFHYFTDAMNVMDFVIVILSILGLVLSDLIEKYFVSPALLRILRVARLVKEAQSLRTLSFTISASLPALFNICLVLFNVMYIYAIFGMYIFMYIKNMGVLDEVYNFKTFGHSIAILLQISTLAGWDGVLYSVTNEVGCNLPDEESGYAGNCGSGTIGTFYILSYLAITIFIAINTYIAIILENFTNATEDTLTEEEYDMYCETWKEFDPDDTQYIRFDQLSDFLDALKAPLQIQKPNKYKIVSMDIPICKGDKIFCGDILNALTKDLFLRKANKDPSETTNTATRPEEEGYEPVSSTMVQQREEYCANLIQNAWRNHKQAQ